MSDRLPRISIVIAVMNAAEELRLTLASIESQDAESLAQIEVVIADGGSIDNTVGIATNSSLGAKIVSEADDGIYDAMNKGAARATGTWLHFLNAGDAFTRGDALRIVLADLDTADSRSITWHVGGAKFKGGPVDGLRIPSVPHRWRQHALGLQPHCHQSTWFRSDLFAALGGYSVDFGFVGDFDLIVRWGATGAPLMNETILIDYLFGGFSEQRASEIPALTRRVRAERLQLDPTSQRLDDVRIFAARLAIRTEHVTSRAARFTLGLLHGRIVIPRELTRARSKG